MGRKCHVNKCDYNTSMFKRALFSVPSDTSIRKSWAEILKCEFKSKNPIICEKHFNPSDIHQEGKYGTLNGQIIIDVSKKMQFVSFSYLCIYMRLFILNIAESARPERLKLAASIEYIVARLSKTKKYLWKFNNIKTITN